jgi:hypothetical protein
MTSAPALHSFGALGIDRSGPPLQLNGKKKKKKQPTGSSAANAQLIASMGNAAQFISAKNLPKAKPHTTLGQGTSGTDHQARNAMVINQAKQKTVQDTGNTTMFQSSQMRSAMSASAKNAAAAEQRANKNATNKASRDDAIRDYWGLGPDEEITSDHRKYYEG